MEKLNIQTVKGLISMACMISIASAKLIFVIFKRLVLIKVTVLGYDAS